MAKRGPKSARAARTEREHRRRTTRLEAQEESRFERLLSSAAHDSSFAKRLLRVESKIHQARGLELDWLQHGWKTTHEFVGDDQVFYAFRTKPLDDEFQHLIYEIAEGLMATLDNLAFAISGRHQPHRTASEEVASSFPIWSVQPHNSRTRQQFRKPVVYWPEAAAQLLEQVQPYADPQGPENSPLWQLRDLANRGKHRTIAVVQSGAAMGSLEFAWGRVDSVTVSSIESLTEEPQEFMRAAQSNRAHSQAQFNIRVSFGPGPILAGHEVMTSITRIHDFVRNSVIRGLWDYA